jgi:hypothetical protein
MESAAITTRNFNRDRRRQYAYDAATNPHERTIQPLTESLQFTRQKN